MSGFVLLPVFPPCSSLPSPLPLPLQWPDVGLYLEAKCYTSSLTIVITVQVRTLPLGHLRSNVAVYKLGFPGSSFDIPIVASFSFFSLFFFLFFFFLLLIDIALCPPYCSELVTRRWWLHLHRLPWTAIPNSTTMDATRL